MKRKILILLLNAISLLLFISFSSTSSAQVKVINITGTVQFNEPMFKMSIFRQEGNERVTVAEFDVDKDNKFEYKLNVDKPGVYFLDCKKWEMIQFWGEDEDINVDFRGKDTARIRIKNPPFHLIKGGPKNEVINHLNFISYRNYQGMIAVSKIGYNTKYLNDSVKNESTKSLYDYLSSERKSQIRYLASLYSDRTSIVAALKLLDRKEDKELIDNICESLLSKYPGYKPVLDYIKESEEDAANATKMNIGAIAPMFECPDINGKMYGPSSFKGKVLLIDFWASWCGPCRAEIPHLKKVYEKYNRNEVDFLSVSIDKGDSEWKKALSQENMPWTQVLAPKSGSEVSRLYQFSGIPFLVIIDKEGKISSKYVRGEEEISKAIDKALGK
jgi:thiol-disulfide isomerase/thioredoxin